MYARYCPWRRVYGALIRCAAFADILRPLVEGDAPLCALLSHVGQRRPILRLEHRRGPLPRPRYPRHFLQFDRERALVAGLLQRLQERPPVDLALAWTPMRVGRTVIVRQVGVPDAPGELIGREVREVAHGEQVAGVEVDAQRGRPDMVH